jgi:hypothetical protein
VLLGRFAVFETPARFPPSTANSSVLGIEPTPLSTIVASPGAATVPVPVRSASGVDLEMYLQGPSDGTFKFIGTAETRRTTAWTKNSCAEGNLVPTYNYTIHLPTLNDLSL